MKNAVSSALAESEAGRVENLRSTLSSALAESDRRAAGRDEEVRRSVNQVAVETAKLSTSLTNVRKVGDWGEIQLRRVLEVSGLSKVCDFAEQPSVGSGRPDCIVRLPGTRSVVIDAKAATGQPDNSEGGVAKKLRAQAKGLASRGYAEAHAKESGSAIVVMFVPGENTLAAALTEDPALLDHVAGLGVALASPTSLLALLKTVEAGWREYEAERNAKALAEAALEMYDRAEVMLRHQQALGMALDKTVQAHNKVIGSFGSRVAPAAREVLRLGGRRAEVPELEGACSDVRRLEPPPRVQQPVVKVDDSESTRSRVVS